MKKGVKMKFGDRIKQLREEKEVKQKDLANYLQITTPTLSNYELNKSIPGDLETLIKIANYFNVSVDYLIGNTNTKYKELTKQEIENLNRYRELPASIKYDIDDYIEFKHKKYKKDEMLYQSKIIGEANE